MFKKIISLLLSVSIVSSSVPVFSADEKKPEIFMSDYVPEVNFSIDKKGLPLIHDDGNICLNPHEKINLQSSDMPEIIEPDNINISTNKTKALLPEKSVNLNETYNPLYESIFVKGEFINNKVYTKLNDSPVPKNAFYPADSSTRVGEINGRDSFFFKIRFLKQIM